jgi:hypothetical protein
VNRSTSSLAHLRLVQAPPADPTAEDPGGDVALLVSLLAVGLVPIAGELLGGAWGPGTLGAAALLTVVSGCELVDQALDSLRHRP